MKTLDPHTFDDIVARNAGNVSPVTPRIIWTASAIGRRVGVSADFVRKTLVHEEGSPVKQIGNRYCAVEDDLIAFFRA